MPRTIIIPFFAILLATTGFADDLYLAKPHSHRDAVTIENSGSTPIMKVTGGYLLLASKSASDNLAGSGLDLRLLASGISRNQLRIDARLDNKNASTFDVLYQDGQQRLLLINDEQLATLDGPLEAYPLRHRNIKIQYHPSSENLPLAPVTPSLGEIDDIMALVNPDSLESYVLAMQSQMVRLSGTAENYTSRDWIAAKFAEFGYDSVVVDPFMGEQCWTYDPCQCYNVMAYKVGSVLPDQKILITGHFDAVPGSPGADDNASGTAAVLEMARVLKDYDNRMTLIFIALDAEESGLHGAYHYADGAVERGEDIVLVINSDMIAHLTNTNRANVYYGTQDSYALLWESLAFSYAGFTTDLLTGGASDQRAFLEAGFDAIFVQEDIFSPHWHLVTDSTVYMNFDYMDTMVQITTAMAHAVDLLPPPIRLTLSEPGDGMSELLNWIPIDQSAVDFYRVAWYQTANPLTGDSIDVPATQSSLLVEGLVEGQEYAFYIRAFDDLGQTSITHHYAFGTPNSIPAAPSGLSAMPEHNAVRLSWASANEELDFIYYKIIRDGIEVDQAPGGNYYLDDDPSLGSDLHSYVVIAVDEQANESDTTGVVPVISKAATLQADRILAVNRSCGRPSDMVDEIETGVFLREALDGYNFDYYSDTAATTDPYAPVQLDLIDMVDYGVMIVGAEVARYDDLGISPTQNGILDTLAYYMSIGGKVIVFGRWGTKTDFDTLDYLANLVTYDDAYCDYFHIDRRILTPTTQPTTTSLVSDLIGAHSLDGDYPDLMWDSLATIAHSNACSYTITSVTGIPCVSFVDILGSDPQVIYTYDSRDDNVNSEGKPVAWKYIGDGYRYIYFDVPLSFFERSAAIAALRQAVEDLNTETSIADDHPDNNSLPEEFSLRQNYPNPFNPNTIIEYQLPRSSKVNLAIFNLLGQKVRTLVDEQQSAGIQKVNWDGANDAGHKVATGLYLYRLQVGDHAESRKMLLLK